MADAWASRTKRGGLRWSWHSIAPFLTCARSYKYGIVDDLVPLDYRAPLALGSAFHAGMEAVFKRLKVEQERSGRAFWRPSGRGLETLAGEAGQAIRAYEGVAEEDRQKAVRLAGAYVYGDDEGRGGPIDFAEWKVLAVEETVEADLGVLLPETPGARRPRVLWTQTPDLVVLVGGPQVPEYYHGLWAVDHKTAARLSGNSVAGYRHDGQALSIVATLRAAGVPVRGFIPNVVTKTATVRIVRDYVEFTEEETSAWAADLAYWQKAIRGRVARRGPWPRTPTACQGRYGLCEFLSLCWDGAGAEGAFGKRSEVKLADVAYGGEPTVWEVAE